MPALWQVLLGAGILTLLMFGVTWYAVRTFEREDRSIRTGQEQDRVREYDDAA